MTDALDLDLHDLELLDEITLVADLMVAAAESASRLAPAAIDAVLFAGEGPAHPPVPSQPQATDLMRVTSSDPSTPTAAATE